MSFINSTNNDHYASFDLNKLDPAMLSAPAYGVYVATPSDTVVLPVASRLIRANAAGVINLVGVNGNACLCNFLAGETREIRAMKIFATGTTATGIEVMY